MPGVFLSYRRTDADFALEIYNSLRGRWGRERIFWDTESIEPGAPWADSLREAVRDADVVLVLIGPGWTTVANPDGQRRLDAANDWVRQELIEAFEAQRVIVPVLAPLVAAPRAGDLPAELAPLAALQAIRMENRRFATRLIQTLEPHLGPLAPGAALELDPLRGERITRLLTNQTGRLQIRAVELIEAGAPDRALEELNAGTEVLMTLLDFAPTDTSLGLQQGYLYKTVGQAYEGAGEREQAERYFQLARVVFERIRDLGGESGLSAEERAGAINGLGAIYQHGGDPVAAMRAFREALALLPEYSYAWHDLLGVLLYLAEHAGLVDMAGIHDALAGLEANHADRYGHPHPGLGVATMARLRAWVEDLSRRIPDRTVRPSAEQWMDYAFGRIQAGEPEHALAPVDEAIDQDPTVPEAWLYRGALRIGSGQWDDGLEDIQHALKLRPGMDMAYYNGACGWALKGEIDKAIDWLAEAIRLQPGRREEARTDAHFAPLHNDPRFEALLV